MIICDLTCDISNNGWCAMVEWEVAVQWQGLRGIVGGSTPMTLTILRQTPTLCPLNKLEIILQSTKWAMSSLDFATINAIA